MKDFFAYLQIQQSKIPWITKGIVAAFVGFYAFISWFDTSGIALSKIDFFIVSIKSYFVDIFFISLIFFLYLALDFYLKKTLILNDIIKIIKTRNFKEMKKIVLLLALFFISIFNVYHLFINTYQHFTSISDNYYAQLCKYFVDEVKNKNFDKAMEIGTSISTSYPTKNDDISSILSNLKTRKEYHDFFFQRAIDKNNALRDTVRIDKIAYSNFINAYSFYPSELTRSDLLNMHNKIKYLTSSIAIPFYNSVKNNDSIFVINIYQKYYWFLFDDEIVLTLSSGPKIFDGKNLEYIYIDFSLLKDYFSHLTKDEYVKILNEQWMIDRINNLLYNWDITFSYNSEQERQRSIPSD